jgi:two-component system, chemotaxis family, chemotaxis protein CheY
LQILVADDDIDAAELYRAALEGRGHVVTVTLDGQECVNSYAYAIERLRQAGKTPYNKEPFDAVILDYKMPKIDGLEAAKEILRINASQRIIFASAFVKESLMDSVKELNQVIELIQKPFEPDVLIDLVEDTVMISRLNEINSLVMDITKKNPNNLDKSQIDMLLQLLRKIQKSGTI